MKYKCHLLPYLKENILSIQEAKQQAGWGITAFDLPKAWQLSQGDGVKVAIIDTGCDMDHPDLVNNLLPGINLINPNKLPIDDNDHGTHCAGIVCASNNEIGMVGVAPKAKVIPIKALDKNGSGDMNNVAYGIRWAMDNGADIISMSLGCPSPLQQVRKAIKAAIAKGIPVFVAAGNAGNTKEIYYPANYPETIAIGSIDQNFDRSSFSCTGTNLDFMAPGGKIFSTVPNNWYAVLSGTSMAAPFAVGVAALVLSYVRHNKTDIKLNGPEDYRNIFRKFTIPIKNSMWANKEFYQGLGILDPVKIVESLRNGG